jgi:hypothetical protein
MTYGYYDIAIRNEWHVKNGKIGGAKHVFVNNVQWSDPFFSL